MMNSKEADLRSTPVPAAAADGAEAAPVPPAYEAPQLTRLGDWQVVTLAQSVPLS